jgi:aromatic amino acid aminotransferase I
MVQVLYVIPTGQNPSGATLPEDRRREIYGIAQQHNLIILEDDPYFHLQLDKKEVVPSLTPSAASPPFRRVVSTCR